MKSRMITLLLLTVVLFCGCTKQKCGELSWTDYNTVEDVHCNFKYYGDECKVHKGDTLKVYGWLYDNSRGNATHSVILTNRKDIQFSHNGALLFSNPFVNLRSYNMPFDSILPENPYDSFLYVTGTIQYDSETGFYLSTEQIIKMQNYEN